MLTPLCAHRARAAERHRCLDANVGEDTVAGAGRRGSFTATLLALLAANLDSARWRLGVLLSRCLRGVASAALALDVARGRPTASSIDRVSGEALRMSQSEQSVSGRHRVSHYLAVLSFVIFFLCTVSLSLSRLVPRHVPRTIQAIDTYSISNIISY